MQRRWGRQQQIFLVRKFRTMIPDADKRFGIKQAREHDGRITRVGAFLRACGMDELPQLLSIWKGHMSFVGPRALAVGELVDDGTGNQVTVEHIPGFRERLVVRPGLTSIATIFIPKDARPRRKFRYDMLYIRRQSFWLDAYLIALSFWISFRGKWETRGRKV
jgi:lipopolysaccharide/colanic/teichoic acid biosynthesis glycosyltransferase